jgi:long-chain acyl-CoA synthetase
MNKIGKESNLKSFELAKNIRLDHEPWSVENDLLTPTFKSKRPQLKKFYEKEINEMYGQ